MKHLNIAAIALLVLTTISCTDPETKFRDFRLKYDTAMAKNDSTAADEISKEAREWYDGLSTNDRGKVSKPSFTAVAQYEDYMNDLFAALEKVDIDRATSIYKEVGVWFNYLNDADKSKVMQLSKQYSEKLDEAIKKAEGEAKKKPHEEMF